MKERPQATHEGEDFVANRERALEHAYTEFYNARKRLGYLGVGTVEVPFGYDENDELQSVVVDEKFLIGMQSVIQSIEEDISLEGHGQSVPLIRQQAARNSEKFVPKPNRD